VVNIVDWFARELQVTSSSNTVVLGLTTFCFDISVLEIFMPLLHGGKLVIAKSASQRDPFHLLQVIRERKVTVVQATPTTYTMMMATGWNGDPNIDFLVSYTIVSPPIESTCRCRYMGQVGGEAFSPTLLPLVLNCRSLRNVYGPTETTIWSSSYNFNHCLPSSSPGSSLHVPIGKPISEVAALKAEALFSIRTSLQSCFRFLAPPCPVNSSPICVWCC